MKKLKLGVKGAKDVLSREELKQILGGGAGSGTGSGSSSCSCVLTTGSGVKVNFPISSSADTEQECTDACDSACDNANAIGGSCTSYSAVFASKS